MKIVDTSGMKCPQPLILLKKTLREIPEGELFKLITLSSNAHGNIYSFLTDNDVNFTVKEDNGKYIFTINSTGSLSGKIMPEDYCKNNTKG